MLRTIRRLSLRMRLALLAAFAIVALAVALFVAWRLVRATETFVLRQADSSLNAAARDLARELELNPFGYQSPQQGSPGKREDRGGRERPVPPHIERIFASTADPFTRLTAVTLHRFSNVEGGFSRLPDGAIAGLATGNHDGSQTPTISTELRETIRSLASEATAKNSPVTQARQIGTDRMLLVVYPAQTDQQLSAWTMLRLANVTGVSDWPNLAALIGLGLSILAVSGLAIVTVRDLGTGVARIESGLEELRSDLNYSLETPDTTELLRISGAINDLASSLRTNIDRQKQLEGQLAVRERLAALGRVVAGVAHEVRNPLAAIKLKAQVAQRLSYDPERLAETFNVITTEIERLDTLVNRLLELGDQRTHERQPVDLNSLIKDRVEFFTNLATTTNVRIRFQDPGFGTIVIGDVTRLGQVVDNIIKNALEAMLDGGELSISSRRTDQLVSISFADSGPGVPDQQKDLIFEPFHTGRAKGTGLGLAIARTIVEEHEGVLKVEDRDGGGATFVVELPMNTAGTR
jgi:signal transduction histidine kinase